LLPLGKRLLLVSLSIVQNIKDIFLLSISLLKANINAHHVREFFYSSIVRENIFEKIILLFHFILSFVWDFKVKGCSLNNIHNMEGVTKITTEEGTFTIVEVEQVRPYVCTVCKKAFKSQGNLHQHNLVHSVETKFKCAYCTKCFKLRQHLEQHEDKHKFEKIYKCPICAKNFKFRTSFYHHRRRMHPEVKLEDYIASELKKSVEVNTQIEPKGKLSDNSAVDMPTTEIVSPLYKCLKCSNFFKSSENLLNHHYKFHSNAVVRATEQFKDIIEIKEEEISEPKPGSSAYGMILK
jgi:Zn finger protein HypA/HybF involved in hydrogenase expression